MMKISKVREGYCQSQQFFYVEKFYCDMFRLMYKEAYLVRQGSKEMLSCITHHCTQCVSVVDISTTDTRQPKRVTVKLLDIKG
jgi:hypothetical protein